jgi:hypothetical protein
MRIRKRLYNLLPDTVHACTGDGLASNYNRERNLIEAPSIRAGAWMGLRSEKSSLLNPVHSRARVDGFFSDLNAR